MSVSGARLLHPGIDLAFGGMAHLSWALHVYSSYLIIIKGLASSVLKSIFHVMSPSTDLPDWSLDGRVWVTIFMFILAPLCFLRKLDSLRHTSYIAVISVVYLVVVVVACYYKPPKGSTPPGEVHLIRFTGTFLSTFPVQVFAFTCAQNVSRSLLG